MKIAFVAFPLEFVGGTKTRMYILKQGMEELGHQVETFYITTNTTRKPEPGKNEFAINNILGFEKTEWLSELSDVLGKFDYMLFFGGCPHLLKNYTKESWKKIYDVIDTSRVVISITDSYIRKYYPWLIPVVEDKRIKLYPCHDRAMESIASIHTMSKSFPLPMKLKEGMGIHEECKEDLIVDICNFKGCKHKHLVFDYGQLQAYKLIEFGDTNNPAFYQFEQALKLVGSTWNVEIHGWQEQSTIAETMRKAKFGLDLSKFGDFKINMDMAILEYAAYGVVPVTVLPMGPNDVLQYVNLTSTADLEKIHNASWRRQASEQNFEALKTHYNYLGVCESLVEYFKESYQLEETGFW